MSTPLQSLPVRLAHLCFACGHDNPIGLQMEFTTDGRRVESRLVVPPMMCGWNELVHGGIMATILDEVMSNGAIYLCERIILTRSLQVELRRPLFVGRPVLASALLLERPSERRALMAAELIDEAGQVCATGRGEIALFTAATFRRLGMPAAEEIIAGVTDWLRQCGRCLPQESE